MGVQLTDDVTPAADAVEQAHRAHWGRVLASTLRFARDLDIAEESTADAFELALRTWTTTGVPRSVEAWLITAARRRAIDRIRRESMLRQRLTILERELLDDSANAGVAPSRVVAAASSTAIEDDDELRLAILCAHPALSRQSQLMLMLKLACGASTEAIAAAFLTKPATAAARVTRAKKGIVAAGRSISLPGDGEVEERLAAVRAAIYLTYTLGHTAGDGTELRNDELVRHATHLASTLAAHHPAAENAGLLALIHLTEARDAGRLVDGGQVLLADVDRTRWDAGQIASGLALLDRAMRVDQPGPYALQAAIAAEHSSAPAFAETDWSRIVDLYSALLQAEPNPTFAVGRAVAIGYAVSAAAGLADLDELGDVSGLNGYPYFHAARADALSRLGLTDDAKQAFATAAACARSAAERTYFTGRAAG
jgi:RNA polymerase sigma-70 factor, ECF subfamily